MGILWKDSELEIERALVLGQAANADQDRLRCRRMARIFVVPVERREALCLQNLLGFPKGFRNWQAVFLHQLLELAVDQLEEEGPFTETGSERLKFLKESVRQSQPEEGHRLGRFHRVDVDSRRIGREGLTVARRDQDGRTLAEPLKRRHIGGTPNVIDNDENPRTGEQLAEPRSGSGYGLEGRRFLLSPPADEIPHPRQAAVGIDVLPHRRPQDAGRIGLPDLWVLADRLGQRGLTEAACSTKSCGDAY